MRTVLLLDGLLGATVLETEARWIRTALSELPDDAFPVLNLGSSTRTFRERDWPYINELIFRPLVQRQVSVIHADLKAEDGVDVVFDFTSPADRAGLGEKIGVVQTIICSNLLEHLSIPPPEAAAHLLKICPPGGHLIVTVPERLGYHPDPIDNGFRPSSDQLAALFEGSVVLRKADILGPRIAAVHASYRGWLRYFARVLMPFYEPHVWWGKVTWFWRPAEVACVLLRKD
jgi:hypothetical protein